MTAVGRPRLVTRARIGAAGAALTLERCTIRAVAAELGVSEMTLYRHVGDAAGLREIVAEHLVASAPLPVPRHDDPERALLELARRLRGFAREHPGIGAHFARLAPSATDTLARADRVQAAYARRYGWPASAASLMVSSVVEHALAVLELRRRAAEPSRASTQAAPAPRLDAIRAGSEAFAAMSARDREDFTTRALIRGCAELLGLSLRPVARPVAPNRASPARP